MRPAATYKAELAGIAKEAANALAEGNGEVFANQVLARLRFFVRPAADAFHSEQMRCDECGVYLQHADRRCCPECGRKHA